MRDSLLSLVSKPGRYIGSELNSVVKEHRGIDVKVALCYPDLYEIGMSNYGVRILYHAINRREDALCERVFAVWGDLENLLRERKIPLCTLETKSELSRFDIVGFSLEYELTYTNMINILDLAGIPLYSHARRDGDPLVIAGGTAMYNPEPVADFLDGVVIGEGEEVIHEIIDCVKETKKNHSSRRDTLKHLHSIHGMYIPLYHEKGERVTRRFIQNLSRELYPLSPIVPYVSITHDRLTVEIMRGCKQGCRFCQAGFITRPAREVPLDDIVTVAEEGIRNSGWDEVSLLSLSSSEHSRILNIIKALKSRLHNTSISFPSLRGDSITQEFADALSDVKRSSLTLAPEAGTERLRTVINKNISDDVILNSCEIAMKSGWKRLKLYFMIGLPTETSRDLDGIVELVKRIRKVALGKKIKVSISPFVPKPHTPFQWMAQDSLDLMGEKQKYLLREIATKSIDVSWRKPEVSYLEAVFSRGDRNLSKVLEVAWRMGSRFEEWSEEFNFEIWKEAFGKTGIDPSRYLQSFKGKDLPWNYVDTGVRRDYLEREERRAMNEKETHDCFHSPCYDCGLGCTPSKETTEGKKEGEPERRSSKFGRRKRKKVTISPLSKRRIRVRFSKTGDLRYLSHLDTIRMIVRAIKRAEIDVAYTKGFRKRPRIAFGPPLPIGVTGTREYFDLFFEHPCKDDLRSILNDSLPQDLTIQEVKHVFIKSPSLTQIVSHLQYRIGPLSLSEDAVKEFMDKETVVVKRFKKETEMDIDIRPFIHSMEFDGKSLNIDIRFLPEGSAKPKEILSSLGVDVTPEIFIERVGIFAEKDGERIDPFNY
jgi:radical SAM family uncharacterized protein/radical SAM-linked protein